MPKILTYNILDGGVGREKYLSEILKAVDPDVILLQEVTDFNLIDYLSESLKMNSYVANGNSKRHLSLLSRYPIVSAESYHPFHLKSTLLVATIEFRNNKLIHFFGVHLHAQISVLSEIRRMWEINSLLAKVAEYDSFPRLIGGDFNSIAPEDRVITTSLMLHSKAMLYFQGGHIFRSAIAKVLKAGFTDCYRHLHPLNDGFTLTPQNPIMRLDYIFADQILKEKLVRCDVVTDIQYLGDASDHMPLLAEFAI